MQQTSTTSTYQVIDQESLVCTEGGSDKEYNIAIVSNNGDYYIQASNGKRGNAKPQPLSSAMSYEEAKAKYLSVLKEKMSPKKKYVRAGLTSTSYVTSGNTGSLFAYQPHLLVPITKEQLLERVSDPRYGFQLKLDGERLLIHKKGDVIVTANKTGVINTVSQRIHCDILSLNVHEIVLDGENVFGQFHAFDILQLNGEDLRSKPTSERAAILAKVCVPHLSIVVTYSTEDSKRAFIDEVISLNYEGIACKLLDAPYVAGKAAIKVATQFKWVIVENASAFVTKLNAQRSVAIAMFDKDGSEYDLGNVTIPSNAQMPEVGDIIDVRYRHLFVKGKLCQPNYLKPRTDVKIDDCVITQITRIKLKKGDLDDDNENEDMEELAQAA